MNEHSDREQEEQNLIKIGYEKMKQFGKKKRKKETKSLFEQEQAINQVREQFCNKSYKIAVGTPKSSLNSELHFPYDQPRYKTSLISQG
jgi:hypothetical protein